MTGILISHPFYRIGPEITSEWGRTGSEDWINRNFNLFRQHMQTPEGDLIQEYGTNLPVINCRIGASQEHPLVAGFFIFQILPNDRISTKHSFFILKEGNDPYLVRIKRTDPVRNCEIPSPQSFMLLTNDTVTVVMVYIVD